MDAAIQDPEGETDRKYVLYNIDEARRYSMAVGVGAELGRIGGCQTCYDAPAGATGFSPRVSLDFTRNNLWGLAHSLSLRTRASTLDQRALLNYSWPRFRNRDSLNLSFTGLFEHSRDVRTFNFKREEVSAQLSQRLSKSVTLLYRYAYRLVAISDLKITSYLIPQLSQPVRVGMASFNLLHDRRDDPIDPHRGVYNTVDLGLAENVFGSQRNFGRFLARNATYHPLGKRLVLARNTEFGDIYAYNFAGNALDAVPLPERFFGGGGNSIRAISGGAGRPARYLHRLPAGGHRRVFQPDRAAFPAGGREHRRGVLSRHGQRLLEPGQPFVPHQPAQLAGLRLHGACGGLRRALPHSGGPGASGLGVQHQSALLLWVQGHAAGLGQCGRGSLRAAGRQLRGAEREPFPVLLFDRTDVLKRRIPLAAGWLAYFAAMAPAVMIDRMAVSVGNRAITESEVLRQIRIAAFLNGATPDLGAANKRATAERMVEQKLIRAELEASRYPLPTPSEVAPVLEKFEQEHFPNAEEYRRQLRAAGLTEQDLKDELLWERTLLRFVEVRFRPAVQVSDQDIQDYFANVVEPAARAAHPDQPVSLRDFATRSTRPSPGSGRTRRWTPG